VIIQGNRLKILVRIMQPGLGPAISDLCKLCGIWHNAAVWHLKALRKGGLVDWEDGKARTLQPTCRFIPAENLGDG
jgi:hypothetical protein